MKPSKRALTILAAGALALAGAFYVRQRRAACWVCDRPFHAGMTAKLEAGLFWRRTCCLRCALNYGRQNPGTVKAYRVTDYATGRWLKPEAASFVVGSDLEPCHAMAAQRVEPGMEAAPRWDRCVPSAIAFADIAAAQRFQGGHGGRVVSWAQLGGP